MANNFADKIKNVEARLNYLKTLGLSSSSSLAVKEIDVSLHFQITPETWTTSPYEVLTSSSSHNCYVKIGTASSAPALAGLRLVSPTTFGRRLIYTRKRIRSLNDDTLCFEIHVIGDENDTARLNNGEVLPHEYYDFKILTTANETVNIEYVERNWTDGE